MKLKAKIQKENDYRYEKLKKRAKQIFGFLKMVGNFK